ncbi:MAG: translation initiation factor IF-2, partial [Bacteroidales bacterium]
MSSVRLNKITRELNVGISTLVEFLQKKGFEVENNPNAKISEEAYVLLVKEFGDEQDLLIPKKEKARTTETEQSIPEPAKQQEAPEEPVLSTPQQKFKTLGKIDLDAINKPKAAEPKKPAREEVLPEEEKPTKTSEETVAPSVKTAPVVELVEPEISLEEKQEIPNREVPVEAPVETPAAEASSSDETPSPESAPVETEISVSAEKETVEEAKEEEPAVPEM